MKKILTQLFEHKKLDRDQAKDTLINISKGAYNEAQIASFITVFFQKVQQSHFSRNFSSPLVMSPNRNC